MRSRQNAIHSLSIPKANTFNRIIVFYFWLAACDNWQSMSPSLPGPSGLYDPRNEHDACGVGFVVDIKGRQSHGVIEKGLQILLNLLHRGACGCEANTGDGAGILVQMPDRFLRKATTDLGFTLPAAGQYGPGLVFLPKARADREQLRSLIERIVQENGHAVLGWGAVPGDDSGLGASARASKPVIEQLFIADRADSRRSSSDEDAATRARFERALYVIRKQVEHAADSLGLADPRSFYIVSLSANTLIYKGMLTADQIAPTFPDLTDPDMESALALVHQRFSTNTFPSWPLAHPYRYVAHNGEINTLRGNSNWMRAREGLLRSPLLGDDIKKLFPIITPNGSDSATFDNVVELLLQAGRPLPHVMAMLIPEAWSGNPHMKPEKRAFYEFHSSIMEPWDGPAAMAFTDGRLVGAILDRNGLRPARYVLTN